MEASGTKFSSHFPNSLILSILLCTKNICPPLSSSYLTAFCMDLALNLITSDSIGTLLLGAVEIIDRSLADIKLY